MGPNETVDPDRGTSPVKEKGQWSWEDCRTANSEACAATPAKVSPRVYPPSPPVERDGESAVLDSVAPQQLGLAFADSNSSIGPAGDRGNPADGDSNENAAEVFTRAQALCEARRYEEAVGLFRRVIAALQGDPTWRNSSDQKFRAIEAEVWAHLGVAMQSLDDIRAAIDSYHHAVELDPSLHVCFANLATLYIYLEETEPARENIARALELEPNNAAYLEIQGSLQS